MSFQQHTQVLENEFRWVEQIFEIRSDLNKKNIRSNEALRSLSPPPLTEGSSSFADYIIHNKLSAEERFLLLLSLIPSIEPAMLQRFLPLPGAPPAIPAEFGGSISADGRFFHPTGETAAFLLGGYDFHDRLYIKKLLAPSGRLSLLNAAYLEQAGPGEPPLNGRLVCGKAIMERIISGEHTVATSTDWPIVQKETDEDWDNLLFTESNSHSLQVAETLLHESVQKNTCLRMLFSGQAGVGKTTTALLLGKKLGMRVVCLESSKLISRLPAETEKRLQAVLSGIAGEPVLLLVEDLHLIFRNEGMSSNQSLLLGLILNFGGKVIFTSDDHDIDRTLLHALSFRMRFTVPNEQQRLILWERLLPKTYTFEEELKIGWLAGLALSPGDIRKIVRKIILLASLRQSNIILRSQAQEAMEQPI